MKRTVLTRRVKIIFYLFPFLLIFGCSAPFNSRPLIESQSIGKQHKKLHFEVIDGRNEKNSVSVFIAKPSYKTYGDDAFDKSLYDIFNEMLIRRFGNDPNGYLTEIKLKVFSPTLYMHAVGPVLYKIDSRSQLIADVGVINAEKKYIFTKTYLIEVSDVAKGDAIVKDVLLDTLVKAFNKFASDFEIDVSRILMGKKDSN